MVRLQLRTTIAPPMIQLSQFQGPWPSCLGQDANDCVAFIQSNARPSPSTIVVVFPGMIVTDDFRKDRVRVYVNDDGVVTAIPDRG